MERSTRDANKKTFSVSHWQMISKEPDKIAKFYGDLFGWRFSDANGLGYRSLESAGDEGMDGGIWPAPPNGQEIVQLYIEVPDIDDALSRAQELGGSVVMKKQVLPDGDSMALALDPLGRPFGLMTRKS